MMFALGTVSSALDAIKSLTSSSSSSGQPAGGFGEPATNPFDLSSNAPVASIVVPASGGLSQLAPATMSELLAAQGQWSTSASAPTGPWGALQDLFSKIDANGDGGISKSDFENALGAGGTNLAQADEVFSKLDTNGDGTVSLGELWSGLKGKGFDGDHHHQVSGASTGGGQSTTGGPSSDPLLQALTGASATSVTNSNGSTTTSLTFADGSEVTMTLPAATTVTSTAMSSYNLLEQMIQREAQAVSFSVTTPSFSFTA
ncbi:MAG: EF-hand domain-containing protein [Bradyrhizobium sp.]|uniref:EF-hand domain-containing protein n=1 Tax=Bradyrhizobium sp. TaxID=376 RepID=UPI00121F84BE|nr:EF-hand domain-containing protein [Bradyrhizobium sp.]THD74177.1 MAG: EF-hand domain-containing protein [Bradyrhizobium sp.]